MIPELATTTGTASFATNNPVSNGGTFQPVVLSQNVEVAAGSYDPQSLCTLVNDQLNQNSGGNRALDAPFLQESAHFGKRTYTMNITLGSNTVTNIASASSSDPFPLPIGTLVEGTGLDADSRITGYDHDARTATISKIATSTQTPTTVTASNTIYMVKQDNTTDPDAFIFKNGVLNPSNHSSLFGSSQVQLDVDATTNKFKWKYLHTPYYDPTTGNQALLFDYATDVGKMFKMGSTGGIAISGLTATVKATAAASPFWSSQLGFSDGTVEGTSPQCNCQVGSWVTHTIGPLNNVVFPVFARVASSTTSQFIGSDDAVQKVGIAHTTTPSGTTPAVTTYTDQQFYALSSQTSFKATADADSTIAVVAATPYTDLVGNATGYFKIDIAGIAPTELVSSTGTSRSVQAVVTRFYNDGNFTSGSQDSGIVYQHVGGPKMISSLSTRILDPDGSIAKGLGPDNTVFLEILKV